ncbi:hypothetical protein VitviT2T_005606 [Vitis vinifera]|uniref:Protein kinase domain-containing protein n=2 Tax=Vitis vinifera TaxID=29760 RepID=A0ABY9BTA9_VITVI|nr:hypothetical protein VitviT2T_005606 [Vitis vinifera]
MATTAAVLTVGLSLFVLSIVGLCWRSFQDWVRRSLVSPDGFLTLTMDRFLSDIEKEKPTRFSFQQLKQATNNFSNLLGSGGFGAVYKGLFADGTAVAVKVLSGSSDRRIEEQFMAEVSTIGRVHHFNLVQLYGFCFERD